VPRRGKRNEHLVDDLKKGLTEHVRGTSGAAFLTELASSQHKQARDRKPGYAKVVRKPGYKCIDRTFTGGRNSWIKLNETGGDVSAHSKNNQLRKKKVRGSGGCLTYRVHCDDCNSDLRAEEAARHCNGKKHHQNKVARLQADANRRQGRQSSITAAYSRAGVAVGKTDQELDEMAYRFSVVATMLKAGVSINAIDELRKPIDAGSQYTLTAGTNLRRSIVPVIRDWELANIKKLLEGNDFAWFHDGATRGVSVLAMNFRVILEDEVTKKLKYVQVLGRLKFLSKSSNGLRLAGDQAAALGRLGLDPGRAVHSCSDACATNMAAVDNLMLMYPDVFYGLCFAHLAANAGSKIKGTEIDTFFTDFTSVMNYSHAMQAEWRRLTGLPWIGYGGVRWFNKTDVLKNGVPTLGRKGTMQKVLLAMDPTSAPGRRLRNQGDYTTPARTETMHVEWTASTVAADILHKICLFSEDQLNVCFHVNTIIEQINGEFASILDTSNPGDLITVAVTALFNGGHLVTHGLQHWLDHALAVVKPAIDYWFSKLNGAVGPNTRQKQLYGVAHHRFIPHVCAAQSKSVLTLQQEYEKLRGLKFPGAMVDGLAQERSTGRDQRMRWCRQDHRRCKLLEPASRAAPLARCCDPADRVDVAE